MRPSCSCHFLFSISAAYSPTGPHADRCSSNSPSALARRMRFSRRRRRFLCPLVLAFSDLARLPSRSPRHRSLALARRNSLHPRLHSRPSLRLGFRLDRPRYTRAHRSPATPRGRRLLPLCPQSHVRRLSHWLGRPLDHLRPREFRGAHRRLRRHPVRRPFCTLLRGAAPSKALRFRLRNLLPQRSPLASPPPPLAPVKFSAQTKAARNLPGRIPFSTCGTGTLAGANLAGPMHSPYLRVPILSAF